MSFTFRDRPDRTATDAREQAEAQWLDDVDARRDIERQVDRINRGDCVPAAVHLPDWWALACRAADVRAEAQERVVAVESPGVPA